MVDILEALISHLTNDMKNGIAGKKYDLPKLHTITNADLLEFDKKIKELTRNEEYHVAIFHPPRIKQGDDEIIFCRLTNVGRDGYHIALYTEELPKYD